MHEKRNLCPLRTPLGCIEIHTDPARRVYVSNLPEPAEEIIEKASKVEEIIDILASMISAGSCVAMVWLVARLGGMI